MKKQDLRDLHRTPTRKIRCRLDFTIELQDPVDGLPDVFEKNFLLRVLQGGLLKTFSRAPETVVGLSAARHVYECVPEGKSPRRVGLEEIGAILQDASAPRAPTRRRRKR